MPSPRSIFVFFFNDPPTTEIYTLSLHDALPISAQVDVLEIVGAGLSINSGPGIAALGGIAVLRSEEHTSELQSQSNLVCRLLLEKKKEKKDRTTVCVRVILSCAPWVRPCVGVDR